ncbi:MAG: nucleotidyltransferase domain-containing protein [Puniceicoccales bacterium]|jgi:hypothetical protein|nr:nucleotidyltransferase domain-containing protein [Puniceicoccales bacterium]
MKAVSAGTKVVVHEEARGSNGAAVHPRGAAGIVARTPAGAEVNYLIRFADGFEISLERSRFEVLKHSKDRPPASDALGGFDLEDCVIYRCTVGSRAHGLDTETSDTDLRGIYQAPPGMQWSLFGAPDQFEDNEAQTCYWELQKFLLMALKANPNVLECLYSPLVDKTTGIGERLLSIRESFLSQMIFQTFNGYAVGQFKKLEQDFRNQGQIRWKHAMHLLRLLLAGAATLREHRVPVRVENHRDRLLAVKRGEVSWDDINVWRGELHRDFEAALRQTRLPGRPDYEKVNAFLVEARRSQIHPVVSHP